MSELDPNKNYYRIHHIRSRFKNDVESVLFFIANTVCNIGKLKKSLFKQKLNSAIRFYPGNINVSEKTINNWRTEINTLFGLIITDDQNSYPSNLAYELTNTGNIVQFFQTFLNNFQYPGGHLASHEILNMLSAGIKFKPARYLLNLLIFATAQENGKRFGVSKEEITHLVFNNLEVTKDNISHEKIFKRIKTNRFNNKVYDSRGDTVRYAGDILDYMVLADLVDRKLDGKYYPRMQNIEVINEFINNKEHFKGYDNLYLEKIINIQDIKKYQTDWQIYSSEKSLAKLTPKTYENLFKEDDSSENLKILTNEEKDKKVVPITKEILERLKNILEVNTTTKQIGDLGEAITIQHEVNRIKDCGRADITHKILKIPEKFAVGFDIKSFLGIDEDFSHISIEVKSTISKNKLRAFTFSLTPNEFEAAKSHKDLYFVYRIFISSKSISMFVIRNPIEEFKKDNLSLSISNGAQISFTENSGYWTKVLI